MTNKETKKIFGWLHVINVKPTKYSPHSAFINGIIKTESTIGAAKGNDKKRKRADKGQTSKKIISRRVQIYGYLPSYSPAIEYKVSIQNEKITTLYGWKRNAWWLTDAVIKAELVEYMKMEQLNALLYHFRKPKCKEEDLHDLENLSDATLLFAKHFAPNVWFDLACMVEENSDSNVWGSYTLEPAYGNICAWQRILNESLIKGILKTEIPLQKMNWAVMESLVDYMKKRINLPLPSVDVEYEKAMYHFSKQEKVLFGKETNYISSLVRPEQPNHLCEIEDYNSFHYAYDLITVIRQNQKYNALACKKITVSAPATALFIEKNNIALQLEASIWTTPESAFAAASIVKFIRLFSCKDVDKSRTLLSPEAGVGLSAFAIQGQGNNWMCAVRKIADMPGERVLLACPNSHSAEVLTSAIDVLAYPLIDLPAVVDTLIICFANMFGITKLWDIFQKFQMSISRCLPKKIILVGDPNMLCMGDYGAPFTEICNNEWIPVCHLHEHHPSSVLQCTPNIAAFAQSVLLGSSYASSLAWAEEEILLLKKEELDDLYNCLLSQNNPDSYHIICNSIQTCYETASSLRNFTPNSLRVHDKVFDTQRKRVDWVCMTYPMSPDGKTWEEPRNISYMNRNTHSVMLATDKHNNHSGCCGTSIMGKCLLSKHNLRWATIQPFNENTCPLRSHIVLVLTANTNRYHLYTAAYTSISKLTIVGTIDMLDKILKKEKNNNEMEILKYFWTNKP